MDKLPNDIIMKIIHEAETQYGGSYWRLHNKKMGKKCITENTLNKLIKIHQNKFIEHIHNNINILKCDPHWTDLEGFSLKEQIHMFNREHFGFTPWIFKLRRNPWWIIGKNADISVDVDFSCALAAPRLDSRRPPVR
jgi:hypothetical protein